MGQIVKRKKKGRPSKADLARRAGTEPYVSPAPESDNRRSLRRRNVKYNFDYDDYLDEYDEYDFEDDEDEKRREKKLKHVLKLPSNDGGEGDDSDLGRTQKGARGVDAHKFQKDYNGQKVKMMGVDDNDEDEDNDFGGEYEEKGRQGVSKEPDSVPGTPSHSQSEVPLPDKKKLELILDKLQKKDIYGVYAEPVDLEELPDYNDIIENPMDFATVRKKLSNGSYSTLEQLESDINLICSNAMQYNAPVTVYYKQARTIQELAKKKFMKLRIAFERSEKELKSEQKTTSHSLPIKQMKRLVCLTPQEPVGSDFSSGATLATIGDVQNPLNVTPPSVGGGSQKASILNGYVEGGNASLTYNNLEKAEEILSGKGLLSKFGRKPNVLLDDSRRSTYNLFNEPATKPDSVYSTFEREQKQLVAVSLHAEKSYATSLARFAGTLGPVAWKAASKRIEQALPAGYKFGQGWVGEYEPISTPILFTESHSKKESAFTTKLQFSASKESHLKGNPSESLDSSCGPALDGKPSFFGFQQNPPFKNHKSMKQVETNFTPTANQNTANIAADNTLSNSPRMFSSRANESFSRGDMNFLQTIPVKMQNTNTRFPNGKVINNGLDNNRLVTSSSSDNNAPARVGTYSIHGQDQILPREGTYSTQPLPSNNRLVTCSDNVPKQMMGVGTYSTHGHEQIKPRIGNYSTHGQQQPSSLNNSPRDSSTGTQSIPFPRRDDPNNAAASAARAWMSIGSDGFNKSMSENSNPLKINPQFRGNNFPGSGQKSFAPVEAFGPHQQSVRMGTTQTQLMNRPGGAYPHFINTDMSRSNMQPHWRGLSPHDNSIYNTQQKQKQDSLPPDLNISFQSSGSPARQSGGAIADSQQPDLALQL